MQPGVYRPYVVPNAAAGYTNVAAPATTGTDLQGSPNVVQQTAPVSSVQGGYTAADLAAIQAQQAAEQQRVATTNGINQAFAAPTANWDALAADNDRMRDFNTGQVYSQYDTNRAGLDYSFNQGNENLNKGEAGVDYTKATSLRDLGNNISAAMTSRMRQVGSMGAGSSSAGYQLADALHNVQNDSRAGLVEQAGQQYGAIDLQRTHLKDDHEQATKQLDDWKIGEISKITNDYLTEKGKIDRERAGGDASKQAALAQQSLALAQQAAADLARVQETHSQAINGLRANTAGGQGIADRYQPKLAGYTYSAQGLTGADPTINYQGPTAPTGTAFPMAYRKNNQ